MPRKNIAPEIKTNIDINSEEFIHNKNVMLKKINFKSGNYLYIILPLNFIK